MSNTTNGNAERFTNARTTLIRVVDFSPTGNSPKFRCEGWFENELGVWARAAGSQLTIPLQQSAAAPSYILVVRAAPFLGHNELTARTIEVQLNGRLAFSSMVDTELVIGIAVNDFDSRLLTLDFGFPLGNAAHAGVQTGESAIFGMQIKGVWIFACDTQFDELRNIRRNPLIANISNETEELIECETGLTPKDLLASFESLGHSCDFGYTQRQAGLEPLGLFRWGAISTPCAFFGIVNRFHGIGARDAVHAYVPDGQDEYWLLETKYEIHFHTFVAPRSMLKGDIEARETTRLPFLRRKLIEDAENAEKIFILKRPHPIHDAEAVAVWAALNLYGPNDLLYISPHEAGVPGAVDAIRPGLFRGYVDRGPGLGPDMASWLSVCANAHLLARNRAAGMEEI
jgi:hypothetical protein